MHQLGKPRSSRLGLFQLTLLVGVAWYGEARAVTVSKPATDASAEAPRLKGLLIDRFMIRDLRPAEGTKIRLSFSVYAEVAESNAESTRQLLETSKHRIRSEVLVAIRTCEQHEFQEPGLDRLRRRTLLRLRRTVPALKLEGLLIGEFEFFNE